MTRRPLVAALCAALVASPALAQGGGGRMAPDAATQSVPADFSALIASRLGGVVTVSVSGATAAGDGAEATGEGEAEAGAGPSGASATGFVIGANGVILAPAGIVRDSGSVEVTLADGSTRDATVAAVDEKTGIAVIEASGSGDLPVLPWAPSADLELGNWLVAIGRPLPDTPTATVGIVAALGERYLSSDMAISPASIGSPVLDARGRVVGVASLVTGPTGTSGGAILPSEVVREAVGQLSQQAARSREPARLGVVIQGLDRGLAEAFGVEPGTGVLVADVEPDSAAAKAGVEPGDVIASFAGTTVKTPNQLRKLVDQAAPGQGVEMLVQRRDGSETLSVTLGEPPAPDPASEARAQGADQAATGGDGARVELGLRLLPLDEQIAGQLGIGEEIDSGAVVVAVRSDAPAAKAGVQPGDIIVAVGDRRVASGEEVVSALEATKEAGNDTAALRVFRDGSYQFISVPV